jgi:hypothetical protein
MGNPLTDVLPAKARRIIYAVCFVLLLGYSAWQVSDGNVLEAVFSFLASIASATAASNTSTKAPEKPSEPI